MSRQLGWGLAATTLGIGTCIFLGCGRIGYKETNGFAVDDRPVEAGAADGVGDLGRDQGDGIAEAPTESDVSVDGPCPNATHCALRAALVHRYSFAGTGTVVTDSIGVAHGTAVGAQLIGTGGLGLAGGTTQEDVALPNGIIHPPIDAPLQDWLTLDGGARLPKRLAFRDSHR